MILLCKISIVIFLAIYGSGGDLVAGINVALGKTVTMSSLYNSESLWSQAVDGGRSGDWYQYSCASTLRDTNPWLQIDLSTTVSGVTAMQIVNRVDCCPNRLRNLTIKFGATDPPTNEIHTYPGIVPAILDITFSGPKTGRYFRIEMNDITEFLTICELELYVPEDGGWSTWSTWTECSESCGPGTRSKSRTCTSPPPSHGGADCPGMPTETMSCNDGACPDDGGWCAFSAWSACSVSCGTGLSSRSRTCNCPAPSGGGADCVGCATEVDTCNTQDCPDSCAAVAAKPLPANCNEARLKNPGDPSGEFLIEPTTGVIVLVYCDFLQDRGYMYLSPDALSTLSNLEGLYDITDHAVIRILHSNDEQHDVEVAQMSMYSGRYPLSFQLNANLGYARPLNYALAPYVYLGFLPSYRARIKSNMTTTPPLQGYKAGGKDLIFTNCDKNPNSYIAFLINDGQVAEHPHHLKCCDRPMVRAWFEDDQQVPLGRYLPLEYFLFYEMHMGGCGGYFTPSHGSKYGVTGASLGIGFEFKPCIP